MATNSFSNKLTTPTLSPFSIATRQTANPLNGSPAVSPFSAALSNIASGIKTPVPSTPLKSMTVNNTDGSSTTHEYHAPEKGTSTQLSGPSQNDVMANLSRAGYDSSGLLRGSTYQTNGNANASPSLIGTTPTQGNSTSNYPMVNGVTSTMTQNNSAGTPQNGFGQAVGGLLNRGSQDSPEVQQARSALTSSQIAEANSLANNSLNPIPIEFQQGRERVIKDQYLAQQNALTGQLNSAVTTQGQQNTALQGAGGLSQPVSQFGVLTDPTTGKTISGISPSSAAFQGGIVQGQQNLGTQVAGMTAANVAAKGLQQNITSYLQNNPQLNSSAAIPANILQGWVSGNLTTDPKYQTLMTLLTEYTNTLAPILGVGGSPTNLKTEIAQSLINPATKGASLVEVLNNIGTTAEQKVQNLSSGAQGGGVVSSGLGGNSGSLYDF